MWIARVFKNVELLWYISTCSIARENLHVQTRLIFAFMSRFMFVNVYTNIKHVITTFLSDVYLWVILHVILQRVFHILSTCFETRASNDVYST
jgi:hypothetical protein